MDTFDHGVGLEYKVLPGGRRFRDRTIIPGTHQEFGMGDEVGLQFLEEFVLVGGHDLAGDLLTEQNHEEIHQIEGGVGYNARAQISGSAINPGEEQGEDGQRKKGP